MLNICSIPKGNVKGRHLLRNPSTFEKFQFIATQFLFVKSSIEDNHSSTANLACASLKRKTFIRSALLQKLIPFLSKDLL